jgi:hypothetical protein
LPYKAIPYPICSDYRPLPYQKAPTDCQVITTVWQAKTGCRHTSSLRSAQAKWHINLLSYLP